VHLTLNKTLDITVSQHAWVTKCNYHLGKTPPRQQEEPNIASSAHVGKLIYYYKSGLSSAMDSSFIKTTVLWLYRESYTHKYNSIHSTEHWNGWDIWRCHYQ